MPSKSTRASAPPRKTPVAADQAQRFSPFVGSALEQLSADLDDVSSLLTDVMCSMSGGWDMKAMCRCSAFASGAQALVDRLRATCDAHFDASTRLDEGTARTQKGAPALAANADQAPICTPFVGSALDQLSADLDDVSSLLTDVMCSMSGGWDMKAMCRCSAFASGAQALVDRLRAKCDAHFDPITAGVQ